ncbi:MAG: 3-hydroxybutyrate dehydrogenase, partial [Rickettsiales bacterium]|nr:3-hydroxybutyrate dehydrogenase [Rickettsiales bacterium]
MKYIALVTGAASGIGYGVAFHLAKQGFHVLVSDLSIENAKKVVTEIINVGGSAEAFELDVTSEKHIEKIVEQVSRIDVLVNNAGIQYVSRLEEFPVERWKFIIDVLLNGPAMMTRSVLPLMRANNFGRIINIGSIHSVIASPFKSAYVAAKHGLIGFSKVVALEAADSDITINTICPSYVKTPLVEQQIKNQAKEHGISEEEV